MALTQEPCCITLRRLCRREPRKQRDRCRPSGGTRAPEEAQGGSEEPPRGRRQVAKPPYRQERLAIGKAPRGMGGELCVKRVRYRSRHRRWFRGEHMTALQGVAAAPIGAPRRWVSYC